MPRKPAPEPNVDELAAQSVAGEEDPGAALDAVPEAPPAAPSDPDTEAGAQRAPSRKRRVPGAEAVAGTPGHRRP